MSGKKRKKSITLIEILVVIFLIGIIGSALAFNMKGSVDQGKIFQSEQNCNKVYEILMMEYIQGEESLEYIVSSYKKIIERSPLVKDSKKLIKDAWGEYLVVEIDESGNDIKVYSKKVRAIQKKKA